MTKEEKVTEKTSDLLCAIMDEIEYFNEHATAEDYERDEFKDRYCWLLATLKKIWKIRREGDKTISRMKNRPCVLVDRIPYRRDNPDSQDYEALRRALEKDEPPIDESDISSQKIIKE